MNRGVGAALGRLRVGVVRGIVLLVVLLLASPAWAQIQASPQETGTGLVRSLESLRDLDTAELGSEEDKESTYISDSLDRLFQMSHLHQ